jgi:hypothetical protein
MANRAQQRDYVKRRRDAVLALLGNKCNYPGCEWKDSRVLQIDHIEGGGRTERLAIGVIGVYNKILKMEHPEASYQLLCANHNWIKKSERNESKLRVEVDFDA